MCGSGSFIKRYGEFYIPMQFVCSVVSYVGAFLEEAANIATVLKNVDSRFLS